MFNSIETGFSCADILPLPYPTIFNPYIFYPVCLRAFLRVDLLEWLWLLVPRLI